MKKVFRSFVFFALAVICIDQVFTFVFDRYIFRRTLSGESGGALNYFFQRKRNLDFLIMGSSRAKHHLDPEIFTNTYKGNGYNVGINGVGQMIYNEVLLDIILRDSIIPKTIFLQTDPYIFLKANEKDLSAELMPLYPFMDKSESIKPYLNWREHCKLILGSYRYNGKLLNIFYNFTIRAKVVENNGFVGLNGTMELVPVNNASKTDDPDKQFEFSQIKINSFRNLVETCRSRHIRLIILLLPYYNDSGAENALNIRFVEMIKHNGAEEIVDFSRIKDVPKLSSAALWKDSAHLNEKGAKILSMAINEEVR